MIQRAKRPKLKIFNPMVMSFLFLLFNLNVQYDLELVFVKNNHVFVDEYMKKPEYVELMRRLGALGDGNQDQSNSQELEFFDIVFFGHY